MGVDLTMLPIECMADRWGFSHSVLSVARCHALWDAIYDAHLPSEPVPAVFNTFLARGTDGEQRYGNTQEDPYGEPLRSYRAADLLRFRTHPGVQNNARNSAVWAYLAEMPDARIVLYWH